MKRILSFLCALLLLPIPAHALGGWLPWWDAAAAREEAAALAPYLSRVSAFAASFDKNDQPSLSPEARSLLLDMQVAFAGTDTRVYLSVVNDTPEEAKSTALLRRLLASDEAMERHINDLLLLIDTSRIEALEIDYENLGSDTGLWQQFTVFIEKLHLLLEQDGIALRVVLPWDAPKYTILPLGPEYSVMCYNLYGPHSGPGPKADFTFLQEVSRLYADVPGPVRMALATGGFDWSSAGVESLTQQQAETRLARLSMAPLRDQASGALTAVYALEDVSHTLWYADGQTLRLWQEALSDFAGFDLFRLGGGHTEDWLKYLQTVNPNKEAAP